MATLRSARHPWLPHCQIPDDGVPVAREQSLIYGLNAKTLGLLDSIAHALQHLRWVRLPVQDLPNHQEGLSSAIGPRGVPGEPLVREVGVVLDWTRGLNLVDTARAGADSQFCAPRGCIQGCGQVDEVRLLSHTEVRAEAGLQRLVQAQPCLGAVVEGTRILNRRLHVSILHQTT
jgi:hypothetical protein